MMFDEILSYLDDLLDFEEMNTLFNLSSAISFMSKTGPFLI